MTKMNKQGLIFSFFLAINLFIFFYLNYTVVERTQMLISNRLYSTWNIVLQDLNLNIDQVNNDLPDGSRVFFEHTEDGNLRSVYQKGGWRLPLISGDSFDLSNDFPQALVGINVKNNLENDDHIAIGDTTYEIIGILGTTYPSTLDNLILINQVNQTLSIERIVIDTNKPQDIETVTQFFDIHSFNENQALNRILNSDIFNQLIKINVGMISVILSIISGYSFLNLYKRNDYILHLLGYNRVNIFTKNIIRLTLLFLVSFIIVFLVDLGIGNQIVFQYVTMYSLILFLIYGVYCGYFFLEVKRGR